MLLHPDTEWQVVKSEKAMGSEIFRKYFIPLATIGAIATLALQVLHTPIVYAVAIACITFLSSIVGTYITYRVSKEYLASKIMEENLTSLRLSVYCSGVFTVFHALSQGLPEGFACQLMAVFSLLCLRTLNAGIKQTTSLHVQFHKSTIIIIGLLIIVSPMIIQRLLEMIFRIPTITLNI